MLALADIQRLMSASLLAPRGGGDARLLAALAPGGGPSASTRLQVYRSNVHAALTAALRLTYPTVEWLVGVDFFETCAIDFLRSRPPGSAYLGGWGEHFDLALRGDPRLAAHPYLPDVARLDYALDAAFLAPDAERLGPLDLARLDPEAYATTALVPHPSFGVLELSYPAQAIRQARIDGDADRLATLDLTPRPHALLVERHAVDGVCLRGLDPREAALTSALMAGASLGDALDLAAAIFDGFDPMPLVAEHLARGRISGLRPADPTRP